MLYLEDYLESECYLLIYKQMKKLYSLFLETKQKSILILEVRKHLFEIIPVVWKLL